MLANVADEATRYLLAEGGVERRNARQPKEREVRKIVETKWI
jgi:hypothetical protein